jgi:hypothetical protein
MNLIKLNLKFYVLLKNKNIGYENYNNSIKLRSLNI